MAEATALLLRFDACRQIRTREKRCTVEASIDAFASCLFLLRSPRCALHRHVRLRSLLHTEAATLCEEAQGGRRKQRWGVHFPLLFDLASRTLYALASHFNRRVLLKHRDKLGTFDISRFCLGFLFSSQSMVLLGASFVAFWEDGLVSSVPTINLRICFLFINLTYMFSLDLSE